MRVNFQYTENLKKGRGDKMYVRDIYLNKLKEYIDTEFIKVITGVRRSGKSYLLKMMENELKNKDIKRKDIIFLNFESLELMQLEDAEDLHLYLQKKVFKDSKHSKKYFLFDEIQRIKNWEKLVNGLRVSHDCDIYITGSNSDMLSGELATHLAGRYVEIPIYPLSFVEFLQFKSYDREKIDLKWKEYFEYGGFPSVVLSRESLKLDVLSGIYSSIVLRDIAQRANVRESAVLEKVILFLLDNIGQIVNTNKIANTIKSSGRSISNNTIENYLSLLEKSFLFYKAQRYDIRGKEYLSTSAKYYVVDLGFFKSQINQNRNQGSRLENMVYLELKRRGYQISIGTYDNKEIDFIASKDSQNIYIQVADKIPENNSRETDNLLNLPTGSKKILIVNTWSDVGSYEGIPIIHISDFLLGKELKL